MISLRLYTLALGAIGLAVASYALLRRKSKTADDVERERRAWLSTVGRITDGTVIDVQEIAVDTNRPATMLIYQYDVAGRLIQVTPPLGVQNGTPNNTRTVNYMYDGLDRVTVQTENHDTGSGIQALNTLSCYDAGGNVVFFLIHRLCPIPNCDTSATCAGKVNLCASSLSTATLAGQGSDQTRPTDAHSTLPAFHYRVTAKAVGPRNSISIVQSLVRAFN